jgi:nucleotide-binding universal stress UspA family protein
MRTKVIAVRNLLAWCHSLLAVFKIILFQILIMRKIILAFDGNNFSEGAFEFARQLNEQSPVLLSGIFLPRIIFSNPLSYAKGEKATPVYIPLLNEEETEAIEKNIERFKMLCLSNGIEHRVHKDFKDFPLSELAKETRYADLLILGSEIFYEKLGTMRPNVYLENALHHSECPVIVVPEKFNFPQSVIIAYDGSKNSVYSIKQFAYLLPELTNKRALVLFSDNEKEELPNRSNIEELAARHFSDLAFFTVDMDFKKYFATWTIKKSTPIVIAGSYGRSAFSQLLKRSFIAEIICDYKTPVFIAHK